MIVMQFANT